MTRHEPEVTLDSNLSDSILAVVAEYEASLQFVTPGQPRPDVDAFLDKVPAGDRQTLQTILTQLAGSRDRHASDRTIDLPSTMNGSARITTSVSQNDTMVRSVSDAEGERDADFSLSPTVIGESQKPNSVDFANAGTVTLPPENTPAEGATFPSTLGFNTSATKNGPTATPEVVGYEILGELGRGGMGVVYKARQIKLNRLVALKMVLSGAHASKTQLDRFFVEAEAVGQLVHPNIVQIHEVGEHDGLPYFSLEYVDGGSLSEKLAKKPMSAKPAAELLVTLARAMGCAHSHGIIHRDLKPANVLLTSDGVPKITDFGLAKRLESDSSQTRSGTLMGTPSYMAPEQARGDTHNIGPLADVYALGVVLYECLTGRTPFVGTSIIDTLRQVQTLEPVPPSRLQPKVPADLETICLKCLQKETHKRYATALDLAEDLTRFLAGNPILARPVGSAERAWRWCKRNPRVAALSAAVLLLLVTVAVGSTAMAYRISQEHQAAVEARDLADRKARDEQLAREEADRSADEAKKARAKADENAKIANDQSALALNTLQTLVGKVQEQLEDAPRTQKLKKELLQTAMTGLKKVAQHAEKSTSTEATMAAAHMKMGQMFRQLGDTEEAFKQYLLCHEITQKRALAQPTWAAAQSNLAATFTVLGNMSQELRRDMNAALDYYLKALVIYEGIYANPKGDGERPVDPLVAKRYLAEALTRVAVTHLRLGNPAKAAVEFEKVLPLREDMVRTNPADEKMVQDLTRTYIALAEISFRFNDRTKAKEYFAKCLTERDRLANSQPDNTRFKWELAAACGNMGDFHLHCGETDLARPLFEKELSLSRALAQSDPDNADYQRELGVALYRAGVLARMTGDAKKDAVFKECLAIREKLATDNKNERRQADLMLVLAQVGDHTRAATLAETLRERASRDPEVLIETARCYAGCLAGVTDNATLQKQYEQKAVQAVVDAIASGYQDWVALETEPDLTPLRKVKEFQAAVTGLKTKLMRQ
jgi:serine/threonine protein kinase/tetratricopeptide (TPR) repeat protein